MKRSSVNRNLFFAILCIVLIAIITLLSAAEIGFSSSDEVVSSVSKEQVVVLSENQYEQNIAGPVVYRVTYINTFLPRQRQLPFVTACLYDSTAKRGAYLGTRWQVSLFDSQQWSDGNVVQIGRETKTIGLEVQPNIRWKPAPTPVARPVPAEMPEQSYDYILLFVQDEDSSRKIYPQCEFLQEEDVERARKVALI